MGLYEIENTRHSNICTIAVNSEEYFEKFNNSTLNKKHKSVRQGTKELILKVLLKE